VLAVFDSPIRPSRPFRLRAETTLGVVIAIAGAFGLALGLSRVFGRGADRQPQAALTVTTPRVVVLKSKRALHLFDGDRLIRTYPIDLGLEPIGQKRRKDDARTPVGAFRVVTKNADSPFHRFIGLDYPNEEAVEWGLARGLVSMGEAKSIREALAAGRVPNWATALGGGVGIHGRRRGFDWTGGCAAVSDEAVEELFDVLRIGDRVEILP